jgi:hypothetical protein
MLMLLGRETRDSVLALAIVVLSRSGAAVMRCPTEQCHKLFVRRGKREYCSTRCYMRRYMRRRREVGE